MEQNETAVEHVRKEKNYEEMLNKTIAEFKELGIYLKESDIGKILDNYKLERKQVSTIDKLIPSIIAKHGEFTEIHKY